MGKMKALVRDVAIAAVVCIAVDAAVKFVKDHFMIMDEDDLYDGDYDDCDDEDCCCCGRCNRDLDDEQEDPDTYAESEEKTGEDDDVKCDGCCAKDGKCSEACDGSGCN